MAASVPGRNSINREGGPIHLLVIKDLVAPGSAS
jgi:hypothetical protein